MTDVLEPLGVSSATCPPQVRPRRGGAPGPSSTHWDGWAAGEKKSVADSKAVLRHAASLNLGDDEEDEEEED